MESLKMPACFSLTALWPTFVSPKAIVQQVSPTDISNMPPLHRGILQHRTGNASPFFLTHFLSGQLSSKADGNAFSDSHHLSEGKTSLGKNQWGGTTASCFRRGDSMLLSRCCVFEGFHRIITEVQTMTSSVTWAHQHSFFLPHWLLLTWLAVPLQEGAYEEDATSPQATDAVLGTDFLF